MSTIVTRSGKGSPLTHVEVDANFTNLNTDKYQEGSAIGGTTPAAGTFTTLTATGQTSLGGAAGSEGLRVVTTSSGVNWVQTQGAIAGGYPVISAQGSDANPGLYITSKGAGFVDILTSNATTRQLRTAHTASAVNYVQVTGSATNNNVELSSQGSDASISMNYTAKNAGGHNFRQGGGTNFRVAYSETAPVNYPSASGGVSGNSARLYATGSDTNIALALLGKGTGAIDLAAGSSGVNISNGGTVTAITRTNAGGPYTSFPSIAISAPTTAGGVQATASVTGMTFYGSNPTAINNAGSGYTVNDTLTVVGGTGTPCTLRVTTVNGSGGVTAATHLNFNNYTVLPSVPYSVTGGTGTGATFTSPWQVNAQSITNAGSGYVEQPTVSFSGGGGSGAAAYATVGSGTVVKSIGSTMDFYTPNGSRALNLYESGTASSGTGYWSLGSGTTHPYMWAKGGTNVDGRITSSGTGTLNFFTNSGGQEQLRVAHTASAVNYVQVTGAATGSDPAISAQGSDGTIDIRLAGKGTNANVNIGGGNTTWFRVRGVSGSSVANYLQAQGNTTTNAPILSAQGSDTNIDLTLTPKGTGATVANGDFKMNSGYGSAATAYGCRAWVNFNGTGTVAIRASGNVSSITDNGVGLFTINITTALPDINYSVVATSAAENTGFGSTNIYFGSTYTTTTVSIRMVGNTTYYDPAYVNVAIFR